MVPSYVRTVAFGNARVAGCPNEPTGSRDPPRILFPAPGNVVGALNTLLASLAWSHLGTQRWRARSDKEDVSPSALTDRRRRTLRGPAVLSLLAALVAVLGTVSFGIATSPAASADNWTPVHPGDFPDPSVVYDQANNTYYAFATQNFAAPSQTINVQVSTSTNGLNWSELNGVDALPSVGSWAVPGETWAPSVAYNSTDNDFVMYYTATEASQPGDQCIGVATSANPIGPYRDPNSYPIVCQDDSYGPPNTVGGNGGGSIDPDIFTDSTGHSWLIWKSDGNHLSPPMSTLIWSVPLGPHLTPSTTDATQLMADDESWQNGVVEGPRHGRDADPGGQQYRPRLLPVLRRERRGYVHLRHRLGQLSRRPLRQLQRHVVIPLARDRAGHVGPGWPRRLHPPVHRAAGHGVRRLAGNTIGYLSCGLRPMYLADLSFGPDNDGAPSLSAYPPGATAADSPSCPVLPQPPPGYWQVAADGGVFTFGSAGFYGSTGSMKLNEPVVGMAATPDHRGYWLVASDGGVFAFGDAGFYGSTGSIRLNKPIVAMISTLDGGGYWLIASDGGVFAFGDTPFYGSAGGDSLAYPVTAAASSFLDGGYWLVDANGQVFNYGNATFEGQPVFAPGGYRITGMAGTHDSGGYWLASTNGNVADFGNAAPYGSMIGTTLNSPIVGMAATSDAAGYWLQGGDGGIFTYGDAPFLGSMGGHPLNAPMVGIASV